MLADLDAYAAQAGALHAAAHGLTRQQLIAAPPTNAPDLGRWSIQQVLVHLWHSDLAATHRMLRIACEDKPLLIAYDETAAAQALRYNEIDLPTVCEAFRINRLHTADILGRLGPAAFGRAGVHNQSGTVRLDELVRAYVVHVTHHLAFVDRKRRALAVGSASGRTMTP